MSHRKLIDSNIKCAGVTLTEYRPVYNDKSANHRRFKYVGVQASPAQLAALQQQLSYEIGTLVEVYMHTTNGSGGYYPSLCVKVHNKPSGVKPKPLECWVNVYDGLPSITYPTQEDAEGGATDYYIRKAVHMREVV